MAMLAVVAEGARTARSLRVPSLVVFVTVMVACATSIGTVGRTILQEREILQAFEDADARIVGFDLVDATVMPEDGAVERLAGISTIEWALGLASPFDVRSARVPGAEPVGARQVVGDAENLRFSSDDPGAYVNGALMERLGLTAAAGAVEDRAGRTFPVEGTYAATGSLSDLDAFVLIRPSADEHITARRFVVAATLVEDVPAVVSAGVDAIGVEPAEVEVAQATGLGDVRSVVAGTVGQYGRTLVVVVLAITLALGALTMFAAVTARRRDFGRRRALGASRADVVTIVVVSALAAAIPGAVIGVAAGSGLLRTATGQWPSYEFPLAVGFLSVVVVAAAALPPALSAAFQDPVRVLRTP